MPKIRCAIYDRVSTEIFDDTIYSCTYEDQKINITTLLV